MLFNIFGSEIPSPVLKTTVCVRSTCSLVATGRSGAPTVAASRRKDMSSASASVPAGSGDEKRGGEPQLSAQLAAYRHICRGIVPPHAVWHRAAGAPEIVHKPVIGGPALQEKASEWDSALLSRLRARQQELRDVPPNLPEPLQQALFGNKRCDPTSCFALYLEQSAACAEAVLAEMLQHADDGSKRAPPDGAGAGSAEEAAPPPTASLTGALGTLTESTLRQVLAVQREFWPCLRTEEHATSVESLFGLRGGRACRKRGR